MNTIEKSSRLASAPDGVGYAVGMEKSQWYVAIVKHNTEKSCAEKLEKINITHYLPIQKEYRVWNNGRKVKVDRIVIPSTVFIKCTEEERREIVKLPFINRFMTNKAATNATFNQKPLATIPDQQIKTLQFMLGNSDSPVTLTSKPFRRGDKVRVIRGNLKGLEGEVMDLSKDKTELVVRLNFFGCAKLTTDTINVEVIK